MTPHDPSADEASGAAHEGSDPAGAQASEKTSDGDKALRPPEGGTFAQLGLDGGAGETPGIDSHGRVIGAAEALPPERAEDLNQIAADDVGATAMAERTGKPGAGHE